MRPSYIIPVIGSLQYIFSNSPKKRKDRCSPASSEGSIDPVLWVKPLYSWPFFLLLLLAVYGRTFPPLQPSMSASALRRPPSCYLLGFQKLLSQQRTIHRSMILLRMDYVIICWVVADVNLYIAQPPPSKLDLSLLCWRMWIISMVHSVLITCYSKKFNVKYAFPYIICLHMIKGFLGLMLMSMTMLICRNILHCLLIVSCALSNLTLRSSRSSSRRKIFYPIFCCGLFTPIP